jgi:VanZ family protein
MTWPFANSLHRLRIAAHGLAMLGTLFIASSDEIHQLFLPNRTGTFHDVMIDCLGGLVMQTIIWLCWRGKFRRIPRSSPA